MILNHKIVVISSAVFLLIVYLVISVIAIDAPAPPEPALAPAPAPLPPPSPDPCAGSTDPCCGNDDPCCADPVCCGDYGPYGTECDPCGWVPCECYSASDCGSSDSWCSLTQPCQLYNGWWTCDSYSCNYHQSWTPDDSCNGCPFGQTCDGGSCVQIAPTLSSDCSNNNLLYTGGAPTASVAASWTNVGADYYEYGYFGSFITGTTTSTYTTVQLSPGAHYVKVRACSDGACSDWSNPDWEMECGVSDISGTLDAMPQYAKINDYVSVTVTGTTSSRKMTAVGVLDKSAPGNWRYCCCSESGCGYGEMCSGSPQENSCTKTWSIKLSDLYGPVGDTYTAFGVVYDYGPVGDTEFANGQLAYCPDKSCPLWKDVNLAECTKNDGPAGTSLECPIKDNKRGTCRLPPFYSTNLYKCEYPACTSNTQCADNSCCVDDTSIPLSDRLGTGACVTKGTTQKIKYLCTS